MTFELPTSQYLTTYQQGGISQDLFNVSFNESTGVYTPPLCAYEIVPQSFNVEYVALRQSFHVNVPFTLNPDYRVKNPGSGQDFIPFNCPMCIFVQLDNNGQEGLTFLITGEDLSHNSIQTHFVMESGSISGMNKVAFSRIISIEVTNAATYEGEISVGTSNTIGLPYFSCLKEAHLIAMTWDGESIMDVANTFLPASNWRVTPPSYTSTDCRGLVMLPSDPDGETLFTVLYYVYGADSRLQTDLYNNNYSAYKLIGAPDQGPYDNPYPADTPPPYLVKEDATGIQFSSLIPSQFQIYNTLMNIGRP